MAIDVRTAAYTQRQLTSASLFYYHGPTTISAVYPNSG